MKAKAYQGAKTNTNTKQNTANDQHGNVHSTCQDTSSNNEEGSSNNVDRLHQKNTYTLSNTEASCPHVLLSKDSEDCKTACDNILTVF